MKLLRQARHWLTGRIGSTKGGPVRAGVGVVATLVALAAVALLTLVVEGAARLAAFLRTAGHGAASRSPSATGS